MNSAISYLYQLCEQCGREYLPADTGHPRRYCSNACKQKAYRHRRLLERCAELSEWLRTEIRNKLDNQAEICNTATGPGVQP